MSESQCATVTGFVDYALSSGGGNIGAVATSVTTVNINNGGTNAIDVDGAINSGARTSPQATPAWRFVRSRRPPALHRAFLLVGRGRRAG